MRPPTSTPTREQKAITAAQKRYDRCLEQHQDAAGKFSSTWQDLLTAKESLERLIGHSVGNTAGRSSEG
jgi:hypothetical protein